MQSFATVLVLLSYVALGTSIQSCDYCSFSPIHHFCLNQGTAERCGANSINGPPLSVDIYAILDKVNTIRNSYAAGGELQGDGCFPEASNMMLVQWDSELASTAQERANKCSPYPDPPEQRSVCNCRFAGVAQTNQLHPSDIVDYAYHIKKVYENVKCNTSYTDGSPHDFGINANNQLVRWNFRSIGCGGRLFERNGKAYSVTVCNWGAGAVERNARLYTPGPKCSECPDGTVCDTKYDALCRIADPCFITQDCFHTDQEVLH